MIKKVLIVLALLVIASACFAVDPPLPYLRLNDRCTVIDLASNIYRGHSLDASYYDSRTVLSSTEYGTQYFYYSQNLLTIGMTEIRDSKLNPKGSIRLTVTPVGDGEGWFYRLLNDKRYKRPFGLDLFARGRKRGANKDESIAVYSFHAGISCPDSSGEMALLSPNYTVTIPIEVVAQYQSIWWDSCLVLDPVTDTVNDMVSNVYSGSTDPDNLGDADECYLLASDQYYVTSVEFKIECIDENEQVIVSNAYIVQIYGYYKPADASSMDDSSIIFYILKNDNADHIDINQLYNDDSWLELANYDFTTDARTFTLPSGSTLDSFDVGNVYMFLSSSNDAFSGTSSQFTLNRVSGTGQITPQYYSSINYLVRLRSTKDPSQVKVYDGTLSYSSVAGFQPDDSVTIEAEKFKDRIYNYARWYDSGVLEIYIPKNDADTVVSQYGVLGQTNSFQYIPPDTTDINLNAGTYTSNIYVHIVSDFKI